MGDDRNHDVIGHEFSPVHHVFGAVPWVEREATASRRMSPVDNCGILKRAAIFVA